ncbi:MAG: 50S ribosomal protein L25 [Myxococcota bacterium]
MEVGKLTVKRRHHTGKGVARKLRAQGIIPGVCYGAKIEAPVPLSVNTRALKASLDPVKRHNTVINMTIEGDENEPSRDVVVMIRDFQINKIRRELTHVDLVAIDTDKAVEVEVPIEFHGKAKGLILGGQLHVVLHNLDVRCKPSDIPPNIGVDLSELDVGGVIHVNEIQMPDGVIATTPEHLGIITCSAPEAEAVSTEDEEGAEAS